MALATIRPARIDAPPRICYENAPLRLTSNVIPRLLHPLGSTLPRWAAIAALCVASSGCPQPIAPPPEPEPEVIEEEDEFDERDEPDPAAPFDFRLVYMYPDDHEGRVRTCDLEFASERLDVAARHVGRYEDLRPSHRRTIRCGSGDVGIWVDLISKKENVETADQVEAGARIRGRVVKSEGGFSGYLIMELEEVVRVFPTPPFPDRLLAAVPAGFDFSRADEVVGAQRTCSIGYAGRIFPITGITRYPNGASHRMSISCEHARGAAWVDLLFREADQLRALTMTRGAILRVSVITGDSGEADHPIVVYERTL